MAVEETRGGTQLGFHYSRAERLAAGGHAEKDPEPKGLFRRNRSLAIILLDIVVIVIMFLLFQFVFNPGRSWTRVEDYRIDLTTFRFENEVYATVDIERVREQQETPSGGDTLVVIRFPGRDQLLDVLPSRLNETTTVSAVFGPGEIEAETALVLEVELLGRTVTVESTPAE